MKYEKLSIRLQEVGEFVPQDAVLLDIGSDHAYLPIHLVRTGRIKSAIAGEVVQGPHDSAKSNVADFGLSDSITVRLASGLAAFDPEIDGVDTITIASMGGHLIADILGEGQEKLAQISRLILQPNNGEWYLRNWLQAHQFQISHEMILTENDKLYEIIVACPSKILIELSEDDLRFGPILRREKSEVFRLKWQSELRAHQAILSQIPVSAADKRQEFLDKIAKIEEVLDVSK